MANSAPLLTDLFSPQTLQDVSIQFRQPNFIGGSILPIVQVPKPSGRFFKYGQSDFYNLTNDLADYRSDVAEITPNYEADNYSVVYHALSSFVGEDEILSADVPINPLIDATTMLTERLMLGHEQRVASLAFNASNFATSNKLTPATKWDQNSSDPIGDIFTAIDATLGNDGLYAAIGIDAFRVLQKHPDIVAAFHFVSEGAVASRAQIASFFGLRDLYVGEARVNNANIGQTPSLGRVWGDNMLVFRRPENPSPRAAAFGYTFAFNNREVLTQTNLMRGGGRGGLDVKVTFAYDTKITGAPCGFLINDCLT